MKCFYLGLTRVVAVACLLLSIPAWAQPTDNPYRAWKNNNLPATHWTDSIKWGQVFPITDYASFITGTAIDGNGDAVQDWLPAYNAARDAAAAAGGGVVFFPRRPLIASGLRQGEEQSYFFSNHLYLANGVLLRGATPHPDSANAKLPTFKPAVLLEFPKYDYSSTIGRPFDPADNARAFKNFRYTPATDVQNSGLVNLDINRGGIILVPRFGARMVPDPTNPTNLVQTSVSIDNCRNLLLFGVRVNNYAEPDPQVPLAGVQTGSQRYPSRFGGPVNVVAKANLIVANCRINDADSTLVTSRSVFSESFVMSNYRTSDGTTLPSVTFDYTRAYGLIVNRSKRDLTGTGSASGVLSYATAASEPDLFAPGVVIEDNWIYHTSRAAIHASGAGAIIRNNIIRDTEQKSTSLNPQGTAIQYNSVATYENRGIDVTGQGILVESNDIQVFRTRLPTIGTGAYSADGEGFYCQQVNGALATDLTFRNNTVRTSLNGMNAALASRQQKGFNGVSNAIQVRNILIENNNSGGMPIRVEAEQSGGEFTASNVVIRNNTQVRGIRLHASAGGSFSYVHRNVGPSDSITNQPELLNRIQATCHVWLNDRPTAQRDSNSNVQLSAVRCVAITNPNPCASPYPSVRWLNPLGDTLFVGTLPGQIPMTVEVSAPAGACNVDSVVYYLNGVRVGAGTQGSGLDFTYDVYPPLVGDFDYLITAQAYISNGTGQLVRAWSTARRISTVTGVRPAAAQASRWRVYPNPSRGQVWLEQDGNATGTVTCLDLLGRVVSQQQLTGEQRQLVSLAGVTPGLYLVVLQTGQGRQVQRLVVE